MAPYKLYIYDSTSDTDIGQADVRFNGGDVITLPIPSKEVLLWKLDGFVAAGRTFNRVLFQTHGAAGCIRFNGLSIYDTTLKDEFATRRYHTLFPQ